MIGIDITDINRFKNKKDSFFKKAFSERELKEAKKSNFYTKIAGKWATKEAAYKAGINHPFHKIEVLTKNNKPMIYLDNKKTSLMVSISHEKEYATAIVVNFSII